MGSQDVDQAMAAMMRALTPHLIRDWNVPAGRLEWSCWQTAAHVAHDLMAYAGQLTARPANAYLPFDLTVRQGTPPRDVLEVVAASGGLLSSAVRTADPQARGWHWGPTDPAGFAALGVNEILMHTHDIAEGLEVTWQPPSALCAAVLQRLFPDAPAGNPVEVLLWCTGRAPLNDRPRRTTWILKAAVD
ncbi:maleylpyruvate isomerase N-terminal domain-containing protein [Winogradskya humida]|uniref:Mycothiol-dependent maleylpyruvate isomerase metal-binding domain-containing protein n=1 Tax=Winogradskya humida TaxID=113566 RepID=A0ABQ4A297_9ACTN|nr:maleylpyruvate isomerase N-terminal domain-containing protein [Actinoplanes humidus]GIE24985.1 hypothetical protein Ahu01nite_080870 [Actinoplanes humidus]